MSQFNSITKYTLHIKKLCVNEIIFDWIQFKEGLSVWLQISHSAEGAVFSLTIFLDIDY